MIQRNTLIQYIGHMILEYSFFHIADFTIVEDHEEQATVTGLSFIPLDG